MPKVGDAGDNVFCLKTAAVLVLVPIAFIVILIKAVK